MSKNLQNNTELTLRKYNCSKCEDKEYIFTPEGEVYWCECRSVRLAKERIEKSGLSNRFEKNKFNNYKANNEQRQKAIETCLKYIKNFDRTKNLLLTGQVGSGKTHLAIATSRVLLKTVGIKYADFVNEISRMKFNQLDQEDFTKSLDSYRNASVLFIDDLYKGDTSPATQRIVQDIVNYRYNNNKAMIITTELDKIGLLDINEATASRIIEMCSYEEDNDWGEYIIEFKGRELNYRLFKK